MTKMYLSCNFNQRFECTYIMQVNSNINLLGTQKTEVGVGFLDVLQLSARNMLFFVTNAPIELLELYQCVWHKTQHISSRHLTYKAMLQNELQFSSTTSRKNILLSFLCTSSPRRLFVLFLNEFSLYVCVFNNIMYHTPMYY